MIVWEYDVTNHFIPELKTCDDSPRPSRKIVCDEAGRCIVNDVCKVGTDALTSLLNEKGKEGWELIMTNYHHGELLCIWKRPRGQSLS